MTVYLIYLSGRSRRDDAKRAIAASLRETIAVPIDRDHADIRQPPSPGGPHKIVQATADRAGGRHAQDQEMTVTSKVPAASVTVEAGVSTTLNPEGVLLVTVAQAGWLGVTTTT
jgi:hypothetical protein